MAHDASRRKHLLTEARDKVNEFTALAQEADGFIFGSPEYYAGPNGSMVSFMDRVFFSASARRGGTTAAPCAGKGQPVLWVPVEVMFTSLHTRYYPPPKKQLRPAALRGAARAES